MHNETASFFHSLFLLFPSFSFIFSSSLPNLSAKQILGLVYSILYCPYSLISSVMNAPASSLTLEVIVLSADNLHVDRTPVTDNVYVVVRAESINSFATGMASTTSTQFLWNDKFLLDMAAHTRSMTFEVKQKKAMGVVKNVGVARIAVSDFLGAGGNDVAEGCSKVLSYRLRDWDGRPNGVINFAVKILTECSSSPAKKKVSSCAFQMRASMADQMKCNGVVIGVPASWNSYSGTNF